MTKYKIITTETFEKELNNILYYIKFFLKEPFLSRKLQSKIITSISSLNYFPQKFAKVQNKKNTNLHKLIIDNFIIIYEISNKSIYLLHIFHNNQNYLNLL